MNKGFSLSEVIIASAVLGLISTSIVGLYVSAINLDRSTTNRTIVNQQLRNTIEQVKSIRDRNFDYLSTGTYSVQPDSNNQLFLSKVSSDQPIVNLNEIAADVFLLEVRFENDSKQVIQTVLTNWQRVMASTDITINIDDMKSGGKGGQQINGLKIINNTSETVVLEKVNLSWVINNKKMKLIELYQDQVVLWEDIDGLVNGEDIGLEVLIPANTTSEIEFGFSKNTKNGYYTLEVETSSGEVVTVNFST